MSRYIYICREESNIKNLFRMQIIPNAQNTSSEYPEQTVRVFNVLKYQHEGDFISCSCSLVLKASD